MIKEISVQDFARWRAEGKPFMLLDVREDDEIAAASIDGATYVPMREIPLRYAELPRDVPIAVMCHYGGRSERVTAFLNAQGLQNAVNLDGGIDAYAELIDPTIPRY
jgi:rhodanese-related sulfurtransferase